MRIGSFGASLLVHGLAIGLLLIPGAGAARMSAPPLPVPTPNVVMALVELAKVQPKAPVPVPGTIQYPKKKKPPVVKVAEKPKPKPVKVALKPTPKPSPTPTPLPKPKQDEHKIFEALRKYDPSFAKMTDEEIRKMPLPPGMKSWADVVAMNGNLDKLDWTHAPPDTGIKTAAASGSSGGFFGWAPAFVSDNAGSMGALKRQQVNGKWHFTFQFFGQVMAAEWADGDTVAHVAYYPMNGKPDQTKTFDVPVTKTDDDMAAQMQVQWMLISQGRPPQPVPMASSASK